MRAVVDLFKSKFGEDDFLMEESAQIWRYDPGRSFVFRIRRQVANEMRVDRLAMRHEQPLRYDWLYTKGMLPEALYAGGDCVARQVSVLLGEPPPANRGRPASFLGKVQGRPALQWATL